MASLSDSSRGILFAAFTALLWGFLPIVLKVSLGELTPVDVTWFRFSLAAFILIGYYSVRNRKALQIFAPPPITLIIAAICLGLNYLGFISGIHHTTPAIAEIFIQTGAFLLAIVSFLFFREKASVRQKLGIVVVFSGLAIFYHDQIIMFAGHANQYQKGVLWTIFGGVMWTCYAIFQKKLVREYEPMHLNMVLFALPALGYIPFVNFDTFKTLTPGMWGVMCFLGVNTLLAYGSLAYALKYLDANKVSVIVTLNPIITFSAMAALMALEVSWITEEKFTAVTIGGAVLVVAGSVMTVLRRKRRRTEAGV